MRLWTPGLVGKSFIFETLGLGSWCCLLIAVPVASISVVLGTIRRKNRKEGGREKETRRDFLSSIPGQRTPGWGQVSLQMAASHRPGCTPGHAILLPFLEHLLPGALQKEPRWRLHVGTTVNPYKTLWKDFHCHPIRWVPGVPPLQRKKWVHWVK